MRILKKIDGLVQSLAAWHVVAMLALSGIYSVIGLISPVFAGRHWTEVVLLSIPMALGTLLMIGLIGALFAWSLRQIFPHPESEKNSRLMDELEEAQTKLANAERRAGQLAAKGASEEVDGTMGDTTNCREPDIALSDVANRVAAHLAERLGKTPSYRDVNVEIANQVFRRKLTVWGQFEGLAQAAKPISRRRLENATFNVKADYVSFSNGWDGQTKYTNVEFVEAEINQIWPTVASLENESTNAQRQEKAEEQKREYKGDDLGYAYPKAVLKLEITKPNGTQSAQARKEPHAMSIPIAITTDFPGQNLKECSVWMISLASAGSWRRVDKPLKAGTAGKFTVSKSQPYRFTALTRDISDSVTPGPFLLHLTTEKLPLKDNSTYTLELELRSRYKWPTLATVELTTGIGLEATMSVKDMRLPDEASEDGT